MLFILQLHHRILEIANPTRADPGKYSITIRHATNLVLFLICHYDISAYAI